MQIVFGANPKGFGTHHHQLTPSSTHVSIQSSRPHLFMVAPSHVWPIQWMDFDFQGWDCRCIAYLEDTPHSYQLFVRSGLSFLCRVSQIMGFGFRVLAFSLCINRGSFSSTGVDDLCKEPLVKYCNTCCSHATILNKERLWRLMWCRSWMHAL